MDNALFAPALEEIFTLHESITTHAKKSLDSAIRIGELLSQIRGALKHGEWLPWIKEQCPFSDHTARNYIYCFEHKNEFKLENVSNLSGAYRLMLNGNGNTPDTQQKLHEPNFHSQAVRLRQNMLGLFNHHLQRRPLPRWETEEIYDLYCSLNPLTEILSQLQIELNKRSDAPAAYRQAHTN